MHWAYTFRLYSVSTKMAAFCVLLIILLSSIPESKETTVEVSVPVSQVVVGGILAIQCQITNMKDDYTIRMFHVINGQTKEITGNRYLSSALGKRVFISKRTLPSGIYVHFMTILDVSMLDQGEYLCKVYELLEGDYVKIAEGSTAADIYYLPNSIYPQCQSAPAITETLNENIDLKLTCLSEKGSPIVALRWVDNLNQEIPSRTEVRDGTVSSEINQRTSEAFHGKMFICEMTSSGFPDVQRTCKIGPITIKKTTAIDHEKDASILTPMVTVQTINHETILSNNCANKCPSDDKYTILYLSMATVGAGMLSTVFLITTVIMCCKYQNISSEVGDVVQRNITTTNGSEPVYVSLQRRSEPAIPERRSVFREPDRNSIYKEPERLILNKEPDRSSTYMSVEDPNNPGNKVLMPKEVFEEFYNSLSLKKV